MHHNASLLFVVLALCLGTTLGCNSALSLNPNVPADVKISRLVSDMDDFAHNPRELKVAVPRLFAPGCEPSETELQRYANYHYEAKPPVPKGDTATVVVLVKDLKSGNSLGEFTWSMKRVTDVKGVWKGTNGEPVKGEAAARNDETVKDIWKLTAAPLPAK